MKMGGGKMSHQAWLERKDRQKREEIARDAAKKKREQQEKENRAAGNNALKFSKWLAVKDKYERAVSLLGRLNAGFEDAKMPDLRVHNVDDWKAIGVAMCAVDCALILLHREDKSGGDRYSKLKKLGQHWLDWTVATPRHAFRNVQLTDEQASWIKPGTVLHQQLLRDDKTKELVQPVTIEYLEFVSQYKKQEKGKGDKKSAAPAAPSKRVLKPEEKLRNRLYKAKLQEELESAQKEVVRQLLAEREEWLRTTDEGAVSGGGSALDAAGSAARSRMEQRFLHRIGIGRLRQWVEEDAEALEEKLENDKKEKMEDGAQSHAQWARARGETRLRVPSQWLRRQEGIKFGGKWVPPRFDFGRGKPLVRPSKMKLPQSSVDFMKGTGAKFIHPASKSDFEKCKQILNKKANPVHKRAAQEQRAQKAAEHFEVWLTQKELVERARHCMAGIARPEKGELESARLWLAIGKALKAVDQTVLYADWCRWASDYKPAGTCRSYWESFEPIGCAVVTGGPIRDLLLRLLSRPGVNWHKALLEQIARKWRRMVRKAEDDDGDDAKEVLAAEEDRKDAEDAASEYVPPPKKFDDAWSMTRTDLAAIMRRLAFKLTDEELTRLVDTFDLDGDGTVHADEFLAFTGNKRAKCAGDAVAQLRTVCSWETVCHVTGMQNAFQVVVHGNKVERVQLKDHKELLLKPYFKRKFGITDASTPVPSDKIITDMRELRATTRSGLMPATITAVTENPDDPRDEFLYSVRFDEGDNREHSGLRAAQIVPASLVDGTELTEGMKVKARLLSPAVTWTDEQRRAGLSVLLERSEQYREDQRLRQTVSGGSPPAAPQLFVAAFKSEEAVKYRKRHGLKAESELLLRWSPSAEAAANAVPSFYVLECSRKKADGPDGEWKELCRDPPNFQANKGRPLYVWQRAAGGEWSGDRQWFKATGLEPNTAYSFRVRAFNGFGASPPTRRIVTTYPPRPPRPTLVWSREDKVCLRWNPSAGADDRIAEMRELFDKELRKGAGGRLPRDDLLDALEEPDNAHLLRFVQRLKVPAPGGGGGVAAGTTGGATLSMFDKMEMNDNEHVDWDELQMYFDESKAGGGGGAAERESGSGAAVGTKYALLQCQSDVTNEYVIVYRGAQTKYVVCDLKPGNSYQFRVQAQNESLHNDETPDGFDGGDKEIQKSRVSESVVVQTMIATPPAPAVQGAPMCTEVTLRWPEGVARAADGASGPEVRKGGREKDNVERMLTEWTKADEDADGGVDIESRWNKFVAQHDEDGSGTFNKKEFGMMLRELGVDASEARVNEAFEIADQGGDGEIEFEDFARWWNKPGLTYTLKMDGGLTDEAVARKLPPSGNMGALGAAVELTRTVYSGPNPLCTVFGLEPNRLYHFAVRHASSTSESGFSKPAQLMTAPEPPAAPVVISCGRKFVRLKVHRPASGAHRIEVEFKLFRRLGDGMSGGSASSAAAEGAQTRRAREWKKVFDGPSSYVTVTDLDPNVYYRVRARCVNRCGTASDWSDVAEATTLERSQADDDLTPRNALDTFQLMCGDHNDPVVVGDTILFSEKLYVDGNGHLVHSSRRRGGHGASSSRLALSGGAGSSSREGPRYIGERTIAARVLSECWTSSKLRAMQRNGQKLPAGKGTRPERGLQRELRLEVVWCTVQKPDEAKDFMIPRDKMETRMWRDLTQFEILRTKWVDDDARLCGREPGLGLVAE